jgi:hypothetical protein
MVVVAPGASPVRFSLMAKEVGGLDWAARSAEARRARQAKARRMGTRGVGTEKLPLEAMDESGNESDGGTRRPKSR